MPTTILPIKRVLVGTMAVPVALSAAFFCGIPAYAEESSLSVVQAQDALSDQNQAQSYTIGYTALPVDGPASSSLRLSGTLDSEFHLKQATIADWDGYEGKVKIEGYTKAPDVSPIDPPASGSDTTSGSNTETNTPKGNELADNQPASAQTDDSEQSPSTPGAPTPNPGQKEINQPIFTLEGAEGEVMDISSYQGVRYIVMYPTGDTTGLSATFSGAILSGAVTEGYGGEYIYASFAYEAKTSEQEAENWQKLAEKSVKTAANHYELIKDISIENGKDTIQHKESSTISISGLSIAGNGKLNSADITVTIPEGTEVSSVSVPQFKDAQVTLTCDGNKITIKDEKAEIKKEVKKIILTIAPNTGIRTILQEGTIRVHFTNTKNTDRNGTITAIASVNYGDNISRIGAEQSSKVVFKKVEEKEPGTGNEGNNADSNDGSDNNKPGNNDSQKPDDTPNTNGGQPGEGQNSEDQTGGSATAPPNTENAPSTGNNSQQQGGTTSDNQGAGQESEPENQGENVEEPEDESNPSIEDMTGLGISEKNPDDLIMTSPSDISSSDSNSVSNLITDNAENAGTAQESDRTTNQYTPLLPMSTNRVETEEVNEFIDANAGDSDTGDDPLTALDDETGIQQEIPQEIEQSKAEQSQAVIKDAFLNNRLIHLLLIIAAAVVVGIVLLVLAGRRRFSYQDDGYGPDDYDPDVENDDMYSDD